MAKEFEMATKRSSSAGSQTRGMSNPDAGIRAAMSPAAQPQITHEVIARKAYDIWKSGRGGSDLQNWVQAEQELRGSRTPGR
jgi:hypothetical protein